MKMPFKPAINIIKNMYIVTPSETKDWQKVTIRCTALHAYIISELICDLSENELFDRVKLRFPELENEIITLAIKKIQEIIDIEYSETDIKVIDLCE